MKGIPVVFWLLGVAALAATAAEPGKDSPTPPAPFAFGVEYLVPGLARIYAATGATWGKTAPAGFDWGSVEPKPPRGGRHTYDWTWPDRIIREYQEAGFRNFHIYLQVRNPWASSKPLPPLGHPSLPPQKEYLGDYAEYVRNIVERYDGDGKDDMPGLRFPVRYWEIEAEWGTFWIGSVEEYLDLLRLAYPVVKQADPQAQVILQGFLFWGIFEGNPDEKELERRLSVPVMGPLRRRLLQDTQELLKHPELFDVVEFHSLSDWTEIFRVARFLRGEMKKNGYNKPLWAGDVNFNLNPMIWWDQPNYPYVADQKAAIVEWIQAMKSAKHPRHDEAVRWFRAEQARFTAKKIVSCMGEGLAGINMGNLEDWEIFAWLPAVTGTAAFGGLIDRKPLRRFDEARVPGPPRPAYWTMKLLIEKLRPCSRATALSPSQGIYAYRFHTPFQAAHHPPSTLVLWYEDGKGPLPGDPEPRTQVALPTQAKRATLTPIITVIGQESVRPQPLPVTHGRVSLTVGETPFLIEEYAG